MENSKKVKIIIYSILTVILLAIVLFLGSLAYYLKGIMSGGNMMGEAIHQSELQASKYNETNSPEACDKLRKELGARYLDHPNVKNGTCPK